jgi:hypothetical protein
MVLLGDVCQVEARYGLFGDIVNLGADRCTACFECTTDMKIFKEHPTILLGDIGLVEGCFGLFGDCINLDAR